MESNDLIPLIFSIVLFLIFLPILIDLWLDCIINIKRKLNDLKK